MAHLLVGLSVADCVTHSTVLRRDDNLQWLAKSPVVEYLSLQICFFENISILAGPSQVSARAHSPPWADRGQSRLVCGVLRLCRQVTQHCASRNMSCGECFEDLRCGERITQGKSCAWQLSWGEVLEGCWCLVDTGSVKINLQQMQIGICHTLPFWRQGQKILITPVLTSNRC